ncbi:hypothetical protein BDP27DRAFT_1448313 [Rhodocollybia butyracea]|uniref:GH16 domain-containing protein n=1 Tax=Rhodocollybia butyracea TaxID=206335 RepID=A0A9P5PSK3_9AGAR|nr:hypothetical protein BDP27DRAFT_1448313 [Rhodocollybia butyracea]
MPLSLRLAVVVSSFVLTKATTWTISQNLSGQNFFPGFKYNASAIDFNNFGNVHFLSQSDAEAANLTFVDPHGSAIIKVDNTTNGAGMTPLAGTRLLIFDANNIPFGCSVWPSLFTQGQVWPQQGEIDIIENVNLATDNRFSLHVGVDNCNQPLSVASNQTGTITTPAPTGNISNCTVTPTTGQNTVGCVVTETKSNSFGSGFGGQGGGVFAMQWDTDGIAMWYFARNSVPSNIGIASSPDPSTWGEASAWYPASGCNPTTSFGSQIITLYIDICGAFAGDAATFASTCSQVAPNCSSLVADPANYANAFWSINYLQIYTNGQSNSSLSSSSSSSAAGSSSTGQSGSGSGSNSAVAFAVAGFKDYFLIPVSVAFLGLLSSF